MKKVVIASIGTHGDVRPLVYLARRLSRSNEVVLIAPPENEGCAASAGIAFKSLGDNFGDLVEGRGLAHYREQIRLQFRSHLEEFESADWIVGGSLFFAGRASSLLPPPSACRPPRFPVPCAGSDIRWGRTSSTGA